MKAPEIGDEHGLSEGAQGVGAMKEVLLFAGLRGGGSESHFHQDDWFFALEIRLLDKPFEGALEHIDGSARDGSKTAALNEHRFVVQNLRPLDRFATSSKHRGFRQSLLNQVQRHQAIIHSFKSRPGKANHIHLDTLPGEIIQERTNQHLGLAMEIESAMNQIDRKSV